MLERDALFHAEVEARLRRIEAREFELNNVVHKIRSADDAMESSLTCMICTNLFASTVTLIPCGHSLCFDCFEENGGIECPVCIERRCVDPPGMRTGKESPILSSQ